MRLQLLWVIALALLATCSDKESLSINEDLQKLTNGSQYFEIDSEKGDTIETPNGTRIIIPPNTLVFADGREAHGTVELEVKEVFDKSEMILNSLSTVSDGRLLESFGMVYLRATSDGNELKISDGSSVTISIPNEKGGYGGELFYGEETDSAFNWQYAGQTDSVTIAEEVVIPLAGGPDSVRRRQYTIANGDTVFATDMDFVANDEEGWDGAGLESGAVDTAMGYPHDYLFEVTKLGWINCDRFIDITDKVDLALKLERYSQPLGYLVFSDINSVVWIDFDAQGNGTVKNLPNGYAIDVVVIDKIDGDIMWTRRGVETGTDNNVQLVMNKIALDDLKSELKKLDKQAPAP